ncbi:hypothetical protein ACLB2K_075626 [Fragaria x ananassa]
MEEQEAHQMMEIHVYTQQGITATFSLSPNDTVKTLFSILMESFPPALGAQSWFHLFFQNIQLKRNNRVRDEIERIVIESKLEEPEQDQIWLRFVPNPSCGSARCDKATKIAPPLPLPPSVASSSSSSSVLDLSDRVLGNCTALHQYNAQLQMEKSSLEKKIKASEQALTSLEAWMEEKARCVQGGA